MVNKTHRVQQEYEVGFAKPPRATRFAKGQSGNPNGRPKGSRNLATVLQEVLAKKVTIQENGCARTITKLDVAMMQFANLAATGDRQVLRMLFQVLPGMESALDRAGVAPLSSEQDRSVLNGLLKRFQQTDVGIPDAAGPEVRKGTNG